MTSEGEAREFVLGILEFASRTAASAKARYGPAACTVTSRLDVGIAENFLKAQGQ